MPSKIDKGTSTKSSTCGIEARVGSEITTKGFADHLSKHCKLLDIRKLTL